MTKIYIENNLLDINKQLSNQITYAIDDIRNIDSKATPFTKTIILPGTSNNNNLLGNIFEFNNSNDTIDSLPNVGYNFNAAKVAKCRIDIDGMTLIKGTFRLLEIIIDGKNIEYECSVLGELGGFVTKLGASKLESLDFSAYDHSFTYANISASWNNAGGSGYVYPLIDYGNYGLSNASTPVAGGKHNWMVGTFRPALFVKEYIDKMFSAAGYTYECALFNTTRFKNLIIPHNKKLFYNYITKTFNGTGNGVGINQGFNPQSSQSLVFTNTVSGAFTPTSGSVFTYISATTVSTTLNFQFNLSITSDTLGINIYIQKNGVTIGTAFVNGSNSPFTYNVYGTSNRQANIFLNTNFATNDILTVYISGDINQSVSFWQSMKLESDTPAQVEVLLSNPFLMNSVIPSNILQKDFFTSIIKLFNLYVDEDNYTDRHLIIKPYVEYYSNVIEDWSLKIDRAKPIKLKPMSELNSRYYQFNYKDDSDYYNDLYKKRYNQTYGTYLYDSQYQFAKETAKNEIVFSPTILVGYAGEDKIYSTIFKRTGTDAAPVEESTDSNIRLLQFKKITGKTSWLIRNSLNNATLGTNTVYPYAGHIDNPDIPTNDINFGAPKQLFFTLVSGNLTANQFNAYYSPYMAEITDKDSRLLTCEIKLNDVDIFNLDFAKYYFIDGGLYRLTKLIDYTPNGNDATKAEFLKLINKVY